MPPPPMKDSVLFDRASKKLVFPAAWHQRVSCVERKSPKAMLTHPFIKYTCIDMAALATAYVAHEIRCMMHGTSKPKLDV